MDEGKIWSRNIRLIFYVYCSPSCIFCVSGPWHFRWLNSVAYIQEILKIMPFNFRHTRTDSQTSCAFIEWGNETVTFLPISFTSTARIFVRCDHPTREKVREGPMISIINTLPSCSQWANKDVEPAAKAWVQSTRVTELKSGCYYCQSLF